ncbi:MAG: hypothetical protein EBU84_07465 [Actinobacteria bacterium]|nr:hypothetical protein [Actinomycetota bacterium]
MSTRKLIALAMACLVAVVIAGVAKLIQVGGDDSAVPILKFGESATVGEMTVSVIEIRETETQTIVTVEMGGVADPDGGFQWRLLADGKLFEPVVGMEDDMCGATTVVTQRCSVVFDALGAGVTVAYARAGEQRNWAE